MVNEQEGGIRMTSYMRQENTGVLHHDWLSARYKQSTTVDLYISIIIANAWQQEMGIETSGI